MKRYIYCLFLLLALTCWPARGFAAITILDAECGNVGKDQVSISLVGATGMTVWSSYFAVSAPPVITDTGSRTYVARTASESSGGVGGQLSDFQGAGLSGTTTIAASCPAASCAVQAICAISYGSSLTTGAFGVQNTNSIHSAGTTLTTGSVTPSECGMIAITGLTDSGSTLATLPVGWTVSNLAGAGGMNFPTSIAAQVFTTTAPLNPTWTFGAGSDAAAGIALYKSTDGTCAGGTASPRYGTLKGVMK